MEHLISPGMKLQKPLVDPSTGKAVLGLGAVLTEAEIKRLTAKGLEKELRACLGLAEVYKPRFSDLDEFDLEVAEITPVMAEIFGMLNLPAAKLEDIMKRIAELADEVAQEDESTTSDAGNPPELNTLAPTIRAERYYHNPSHLLSERQVLAAMQGIDQIESSVRAGGAPEYLSTSRIVKVVIEAIVAKSAALNTGIELRIVNQPHDLSHPINVMILSLVIGHAMHYTQEQLLQLGLASLFHDIGKTAIPKLVLDKVGPLSPRDVELLRAHTLIGKKLMEKFLWAEPLMGRIVLEHHERNDGSGYPHRLQERQIHEMSKIVAVAEVYDALVSDTNYRKRFKPEVAYNSIKVGDRNGLDPKVIHAFERYIVPYPLNTWVTLEPGETAQVVKQNKGQPFRPVVTMAGRTINLADQNVYRIADIQFNPF